jgi:hypothetical protein
VYSAVVVILLVLIYIGARSCYGGLPPTPLDSPQSRPEPNSEELEVI